MGTEENNIIQRLASFLSELDSVFSGKTHCLIIVHDNPDPDSIASACALKFFVKQRYGLSASVAYGGVVRRAENRAMLQKLQIKMKQISRIKLSKYDMIALVDTQTGAGNNPLPDNKRCDLVIDHHPARDPGHTDAVLVIPEIGATATILVELLKTAGIQPKSDLATALSYAISSETQNMKRETSQMDIEAFLYVYNKCNMRTLGEIIHPKLPRSYFITLARALENAYSFRNLICTHLGEVPQPEIVSEMADFFQRHERITRVFCTGRFKDFFILSIRASTSKAHAGKIIQKLVKNQETAGGHEMTAGGYIPVGNMRKDEIASLEDSLRREFARLMGYEDAEWNRIIEPRDGETGT
ncbi:MAG: phosphoesterase [Spirochaetaceae bacterium]|nr:MAG: phosphoesterase [Spirochaetaceae bacterium]